MRIIVTFLWLLPVFFVKLELNGIQSSMTKNPHFKQLLLIVPLILSQDNAGSVAYDIYVSLHAFNYVVRIIVDSISPYHHL